MAETNWKVVQARRDLLNKAREAFTEASDGNAPTGDANVVTAGLACLIAQCEGRLIPTATAEDIGRRRVVAAIGQLITTLRPDMLLKGIAFNLDTGAAVPGR